jgi:lipopolysaccharide/colanic/teichoic acid biosynthesis glycosyltransferase
MTKPTALLRRKTDSLPVTIEPRDKSLGSRFIDRADFVRRLYLERKRTERSGRPFILMLLETDSLLKAGADKQAIQELVVTIVQTTRETDVIGWYKEGQILGTIFTEVDSANTTAVTAALFSRVKKALASTLAIDNMNEIRLSFHMFPEDSGCNGSEIGADRVLYPELESDGRGSARMLKRGIDIVGSLCALLFSAPLAVPIAIAIKLTSRGPVFFRQQRVGQYGKPFTFLKFRSMYAACDHTVHRQYVKALIKDEVASEERVFKLTNDHRVTPAGRFLRKSSLDELPQFINVLKGEMSLVGPRPAIPYEVEHYDVWHRPRVLAVKPGITGLWQIGGRSRTNFSDMIRLDLLYARSWTPWLDIKILLKTPRAVLSGEGAH